MPESWAARDEFADRMQAVGMMPPPVVTTLKEMKIQRDRLYHELHALEKEALVEHERRLYEMRAQKSAYQPPPDEWRTNTWSQTADTSTATEAALWKRASEPTTDHAECRRRFEEARAGNVRRIEYEQSNGIWADKSGTRSSSSTTYMVEQLSKSEAEKLFAQSSASSSGRLDMPTAGKPQVLKPGHALDRFMDWSTRTKRTGEDKEEEQIKLLEDEKMALQLQLEEIENQERSLKPTESSKRPARQDVLGARRSDATYDKIAQEKKDRASAAAAARVKDEPSDEEFSRPGANTLFRTAESRRPELGCNFRGEPS